VRKRQIEDVRIKALAEQEAIRQARIDALKASLNNLTPTKTNQPILSKTEQYLKDLSTKYPEGITEEDEDGPNFKLLRIVIVASGKATEYKKIVYNYGGVFCKKNGIDISESTFKQETKK
jgi:hypothetical protein